jgi:RimJ/RimL family protein N-acetyltransferase
VTLADDELLLREPTEEDIPAITEACQDPEIPRWTRVPSPYTEDDARTWLGLTGEDRFLIVDRKSGELLGGVGIRPDGEGAAEIGYWVKREARGRGIAPRAVRLLSEWGLRERGLARISLMTEPANTASQRVAEKAGYRREGLLRAWMELKGTRRDFVMFSLIPEDL